MHPAPLRPFTLLSLSLVATSLACEARHEHARARVDPIPAGERARNAGIAAYELREVDPETGDLTLALLDAEGGEVGRVVHAPARGGVVWTIESPGDPAEVEAILFGMEATLRAGGVPPATVRLDDPTPTAPLHDGYRRALATLVTVTTDPALAGCLAGEPEAGDGRDHAHKSLYCTTLLNSMASACLACLVTIPLTALLDSPLCVGVCGYGVYEFAYCYYQEQTALTQSDCNAMAEPAQTCTLDPYEHGCNCTCDATACASYCHDLGYQTGSCDAAANCGCGQLIGDGDHGSCTPCLAAMCGTDYTCGYAAFCGSCFPGYACMGGQCSYVGGGDGAGCTSDYDCPPQYRCEGGDCVRTDIRIIEE